MLVSKIILATFDFNKQLLFYDGGTCHIEISLLICIWFSAGLSHNASCNIGKYFPHSPEGSQNMKNSENIFHVALATVP